MAKPSVARNRDGPILGRVAVSVAKYSLIAPTYGGGGAALSRTAFMAAGSLFRYLTSVGGGLQQLRWLGCGHGLHYRPLSHDLDNAQVLDFVR